MISVIMPTYNRAKTIKRAIDSVLNQTYSDLELIIIDDCSNDNTYEIIRKIKSDKIKYYKLEENKGACYARNYGISKISGDLIAFQDSDDEWINNKLEIQLKNMTQNNSDIDFCAYYKYLDNQKIYLPNAKYTKRINKYGFEKSLRYGNFISTQLLLIKKECLNNYLFDVSLPRLQDYDLILRLSEHYKISFTNIPLVNMYVQNDSISKSTEKLKKATEIMANKEYTYKKILLNFLYDSLAYEIKDVKIKEKLYLKSLKNRFNLKTLIKFIICH